MHEKLDDLRTTDRSWKQSEVEVPPGHARHRRQRLPVKVILQHRRLSAWRPGTAAVRALAQSALVDEDDGAPLFAGFFLISGQRFCFHSRIFSSSRSSARPTGRWQLQPNCRRMRQACEAWYGIAGIAAPALNAALTEVSKPLAGLMLTFEAGHLISPLALCGETSQNICGSEAWVTPRFGLAPTSVDAEAGVLNQLFNWWRRHSLHLRFATAQRLDYVGPFVFDSPKSFLLRSEIDTAFFCRFPFNLFRLYKSLCGSHHSSQRLRIFLNIEARLLKLLSYLLSIQAFFVARENVEDRLGKTRLF